MSGITSGVGVFSGIDTASLIRQILAVEARPQQLAQQRLFDLQLQQAAVLAVNSQLSSLSSFATGFRTNNIFNSKSTQSADESVLTASAGSTAQEGSYRFLVDQLVTSQQMLSRGFADPDSTAIGASAFTFESSEGQITRSMELSELNGGQGVERGTFTITQGSQTTTIDLSRAATVGEVLEAINTNGVVDVEASLTDDGFTLTSGSGSFTVANTPGSSTADSLGLAGSSADVGGTETLSGSNVYSLSNETSVSLLNDGNGVELDRGSGTARFDFTITVDGTAININLGEVSEDQDGELVVTEGPASTVGQVIDRVNTALSDAGFSDVELTIGSDGARFELSNDSGRSIEVTENGDTNTARDLGLRTDAPTTSAVTGERVLAGLNSTLLKNIDGGSGLAGAGEISFTARDGTSFDVDLSGAETVREVIDLVNSAAGNNGEIVLSINRNGTGFSVLDTTGGSGNLTIGDTGGGTTSSDSLGLTVDDAVNTYEGTNVQHAYVAMTTGVDELNRGAGIGTGTFRVTDAFGVSTQIDINDSIETVQDLLAQVNNRLDLGGLEVKARINDQGDGLTFEHTGATDGTQAIVIADEIGRVAQNLRVEGEAGGFGPGENIIDGSYETNVEFEATDTLEEIVQKINDGETGLRATIINDGSGSASYRINLVAEESGRDGRIVVDTNGFDLTLNTLDAGQDARVFFGSDDPAEAILLTSSSNTLDNVISGVTIDLRSTSDEAVELNVSVATDEIEAQMEGLADALNSVFDEIDNQSRFVEETNQRGPLLGDSTVLSLRTTLFNTVLGEPLGVTGRFQNLTDVGFGIESGGTVTFDREKFRQAFEQDPEAVESLLAARDQEQRESEITIADGVTVRNTSSDDEFSQLGIVGLLEQLADGYIDSVDGILTVKNESLDSQIQLQNDRIQAYDVQLNNRRTILETQFVAMEQAIAQLQTQQATLSTIG